MKFPNLPRLCRSYPTSLTSDWCFPSTDPSRYAFLYQQKGGEMKTLLKMLFHCDFKKVQSLKPNQQQPKEDTSII